jgi:hypothetical protein
MEEFLGKLQLHDKVADLRYHFILAGFVFHKFLITVQYKDWDIFNEIWNAEILIVFDEPLLVPLVQTFELNTIVNTLEIIQ